MHIQYIKTNFIIKIGIYALYYTFEGNQKLLKIGLALPKLNMIEKFLKVQ